MRKWMTIPLIVLMMLVMVFSTSAEAQKVLDLDFSDSSCVVNDEKAGLSKGTLTIEDGVLKLSGWTPGTTTAANYIKTAGILPENVGPLGTLTIEYEFTPQDVSWLCSGLVIGDQANGTEQDAVIVGFNGNDFKLETRGQITLNMGGILTTLGEFDTGFLIPDMTYIVRVYKDNTAGTVELYFYEKDGRVPDEPTLLVQSDIVKTITGNISFTAYAGRYTVDNVKVWNGEVARPTNPPTTTRTTTTTTKATEETDATSNASSVTTSNGDTDDSDVPDVNNTNGTLIVILCVAGVVVVGAAAAILFFYFSSKKKTNVENNEEG